MTFIINILIKLIIGTLWNLQQGLFLSLLPHLLYEARHPQNHQEPHLEAKLTF